MEGRETERLAGFTARAVSAPDGFERARARAAAGEREEYKDRGPYTCPLLAYYPEASTVTQEGGKKGNGM